MDYVLNDDKCLHRGSQGVVEVHPRAKLPSNVAQFFA